MIKINKKDIKDLPVYMGRWQLSSLILYPCIAFLPLNPLAVTIIANLIGALIFFPIDNWIFNRKNKKNITG